MRGGGWEDKSRNFLIRPDIQRNSRGFIRPWPFRDTLGATRCRWEEDEVKISKLEVSWGERESTYSCPTPQMIVMGLRQATKHSSNVALNCAAATTSTESHGRV